MRTIDGPESPASLSTGCFLVQGTASFLLSRDDALQDDLEVVKPEPSLEERLAGALTDSIIKVHPVTGAQTVISSGGLFVDPHGVAIEANGDLIVSETHIDGVHQGALIRVNSVTGAQTLIARGGRLIRLVHVTIDVAGQIIVASPGFNGFANGIIKVNQPPAFSQSSPPVLRLSRRLEWP
jgi:hypothetical protein